MNNAPNATPIWPGLDRWRLILLARRLADVLDDLLDPILRQIGMLSHLRSCERYDEPETLPSSIRLICLTSADGRHSARPFVISS
jgi:hypothetical protein